MENKIKTLSVFWWFIDYGVFGKFTYFLIDFRDSLSTSFNVVAFDLDRYLLLKDPNFVKKGLEDFLNTDRELRNVFYLKESKEQYDLINYYALQENFKLVGRSEIELTPEIEKNLKEKLYIYFIRKGISEEKAIELVDKLFTIS